MLVRNYKSSVEYGNINKGALLSAAIVRMITDNYAYASLETIADKLGYSKSYASRYIKEITGKSFRDFLREVKFRKAEELLKKLRNISCRIQKVLRIKNPPYNF